MAIHLFRPKTQGKNFRSHVFFRVLIFYKISRLIQIILCRLIVKIIPFHLEAARNPCREKSHMPPARHRIAISSLNRTYQILNIKTLRCSFPKKASRFVQGWLHNCSIRLLFLTVEFSDSPSQLSKNVFNEDLAPVFDIDEIVLIKG